MSASTQELWRTGRFLRLSGLALAATLLALAIVSLQLSHAYVDAAVTGPCPAPALDPADFGLAALRPVSFSAADGVTLRGWYQAGAGRAAIILAGGRAGWQSMLPEAAILARDGYGVLLFDWRGCGASDSALHTLGYHETRDLLAAVSYLRRAGAGRIGILGFSLGGAAAIRAAAVEPAIMAVVAMGNYHDLRAEIYGAGDESPLLVYDIPNRYLHTGARRAHLQ